MDSISEKNCLEEISTLVFDSCEKVSLKTISNNWQISSKDSNAVLLKWLDQNRSKVKKTEVVSEFLVQGTNTKGVYSLAFVSEDKKKILEQKWSDFKCLLFSIEIKSNSRKLDLPDYDPIKVKRISLVMKDPRDLVIPELPTIKQEPTTSKKPDTTKPKTPFNMTKPAAVKTETKQPKAQEKTKSPPAKSPEKKVEEVVKVSDVKAEKKSPVEKPSSKPAANKKTQNLKNQKPVQKGSISSFFGNSSKPSTSKPTTVAVVKEEPKPEPKNSRKRSSSPEEVAVVETKKKPTAVAVVKKEPKPDKVEPKNSRKRSSSPEEVAVVETKKKPEEKKKPAAKKIKLKALPNNKRSRIRVMEDSSEEEEEEKEPEEPESKFIKFDRELTPESESLPSQPHETPEKKPEEVEIVVKGSHRKAKRWVTKRFETDDGFIRTERVQEEYSASEDENDENRKKNSPPSAKTVSAKKSAEKKQPAKAKPAPVKGKQGNIMSFFSKK